MDNIFFSKDRDKVLNRCFLNDIKKIVNVGINYESSIQSLSLANKYSNIYATVGIHPLEVEAISENIIPKIYELAISNKVVAIGETGLDYTLPHYNKELQKKWFKEHLNIAKNVNLPVIIHSRMANQDTLEILNQTAVLERGGVVHCFSGDLKMANEYISRNLFISFSGNITYDENKKIKEVIKNIDISRLLIETDSPYISPEPLRYRRNSPLNIKYIFEEVAKIRKMDFEELSEIVYRNSQKLFGI